LPVLDTEFLFAMRHSDSKHHFIKSILDDLERIAPDKKKELVIPPLAIFELVIVCMSEGKTIEIIIQTLELIKDIIARYKLEIIGFNLDQVIRGLGVYKDFKRGFFDSLIAGSALAYDGVIIGDDEAFLNIPNLIRKSFSQYLKELREIP